MTTDLDVVRPASRLYRVGRRPDPWAWPPWEFAGTDGTFGNRWDDPKAFYRVLYACSELKGCFVEVFSRFRPDPNVIAGLAAIRTEGEDEALPPGILPRSILDTRCIGIATVDGQFVDIGTALSLAHLHYALAPRLIHYRIAELDAAAIRTAAPRQFTQEISRYVFEHSDERGEPRFRGIEYESRFGDNFQNWAIFEQARPGVSYPEIVSIGPDNDALQSALHLLGVKIR